MQRSPVVLAGEIRNVFDATNDVSSALAFYLALTEIASHEQSDTFTRRIGEIARRAGLSYRTAAKILSRFEALNVIRIQRNKVAGTQEHSPSTYTLGNGCPRLGNDRKHDSLPRVKKKSPEKSQKNVVEERACEHAETATLSELYKIAKQCGEDGAQLCAALQPHFQKIDVKRELRAYHKWTQKYREQARPSRFVRWLARTEPALKPPRRKHAGSNGANARYEQLLRESMARGDQENDLRSKSSEGRNETN